MQRRDTLFASLCALLCASCDADYVVVSFESNPTLPPDPPTSSVSLPLDPQVHGRFIGAVRIHRVDHFADALIAQDGRVRLYIGAPSTKTGLLQVMKAQRTMQFVGTIDLRGGGLYGSGMVINEACISSRDCAAPTPAELNIAQSKSEMRGELRLLDPVSSGESWSVDLSRWETSDAQPTEIYSLAGQYEELISVLSAREGALIRIDENGVLTFEDIYTGCIGRGALSLQASSSLTAYDVSLHLSECNATHARMNGDFEGMAAEGPSSLGNSDSLLRIWLSAQPEVGTASAVTLLARRW